KGVEQGLHELESKALSVGTSADGGYLVPDETERQIDRLLSVASPIRAIAGVQKISGNVYKKPFATSAASTGWVGETAARPQTTTPTLAELSFPAMEIYAMPSATQTILDDAAVDTEAWLADEVQIIFAEQESLAFVSGDGVSKPKGFLSYTNVANASWTWGNVGYLATGVSGAFAASNPSDALVNLIYTLKQGYRSNADWVLNRNVQADIRKFKDANGLYLWQPSLQAGQPSTLLGYPVTESEDMPSLGTNSFSIAFGDFKRGYLVVDRLGIRVLRDPITAKPYVLFYTTKRVGGGVQNFEAIKLLKFGVS
ncbi:MAG: phage major capsid protein, partial [Alphaproteobacteria bacterium]|nr:phage major capsid protein [Alphaproteobacteria bacterium]